MPYEVVKSGSGYKVKNKDTGETYSKEPMSKEKAEAQKRAMYANTNESKETHPLLRNIDKRLDDLL